MDIEPPIDEFPVEIGNYRTNAKSYFYHHPISWIGREPNLENKRVLNFPNIIFKKLSCGISLNVRQDGLFELDFENFQPCDGVIIPQFKARDGFKLKLPAKLLVAENVALEHAFNRCVVMNCLIACLNSSIGALQKHAIPITQFSSPANYLTSELNPHWNPLHAQYSFNSKIIDRSTIISFETVYDAVETLDNLIQSHGFDSLLILNSIYQAHYLFWNLDFSNSLLLAWMTSEKLLYGLFAEFLDSRASDFIPKRKQKLKDGRTFTAAIILELMDAWQCIPTELYLDLEQVRKARNDWVHKLGNANMEVSTKALSVSQQLFESKFSTKVSLTIGCSYSY